MPASGRLTSCSDNVAVDVSTTVQDIFDGRRDQITLQWLHCASLFVRYTEMLNTEMKRYVISVTENGRDTKRCKARIAEDATD